MIKWVCNGRSVTLSLELLTFADGFHIKTKELSMDIDCMFDAIYAILFIIV